MKTTTLILNIRVLAMTSLMAFGGLFFSSPAFGATRVWQPTSGANDYNTAANWSGSIIPTNGDVAYFAGTGQTQTVLLNDSPATNANVYIAATNGTLTFESTKSTPGTLTLKSTSTTTFGAGSGTEVVIGKTGTSDFLFSATALTVGNTNQNNNTVTVQGAGVTLEAAGGLLIVGFDTSHNNLVHVQQGARLASLGATIGRLASTNNTVRLSDAGTIWTLAGNPSTYNLTIGVVAGSDNNHLIVENGALLRSTAELRAYRGTVQLNNGTIDLTYDSGGYTTDQALVFQAAGRLRGQGTLKASEVKSTGVGALVEVGESSFGVLNATLTGAAGWNNTNIELQLSVGDLTGTPVAGVNYDWLNINGTFTSGGKLTIDLISAVLPQNYALAMISWTNFVGSTNSMTVNFINGDALKYEYRADGLYIVPEPSSMMLLLGGAVAALAWRMRRRAS